MCRVAQPLFWVAAVVVGVGALVWTGLLPTQRGGAERFRGVATLQMAGSPVTLHTTPTTTLSGPGGVVVGTPVSTALGVKEGEAHIYLSVAEALRPEPQACFKPASLVGHRTFINSGNAADSAVIYDTSGHLLNPTSLLGVPTDVCAHFLPGGTLVYNPPNVGAALGCHDEPTFFGLFCVVETATATVTSSPCLTWTALTPHLISCSSSCVPDFTNDLDDTAGTPTATGTTARPSELFAAFDATGELVVAVKPMTPLAPDTTLGWDVVLRANFDTEATDAGLGDAYFFLTGLSHGDTPTFQFVHTAPYCRHFLDSATFGERFLAVSLVMDDADNAPLFAQAGTTIHATVHNIWAGDSVTVTAVSVRPCTSACPCQHAIYRMEPYVAPPPPPCPHLDTTTIQLVTLGPAQPSGFVVGLQVPGRDDTISFAGHDDLLTEDSEYAPLDLTSGQLVLELHASVDSTSGFSALDYFGFDNLLTFGAHGSHFFSLGSNVNPLDFPVLLMGGGWTATTTGTLALHRFDTSTDCSLPVSTRFVTVAYPECPRASARDRGLQGRLAFGIPIATAPYYGQLEVVLNEPVDNALTRWVTCPVYSWQAGDATVGGDQPACGGSIDVPVAPVAYYYLFSTLFATSSMQQVAVANPKGGIGLMALYGTPGPLVPAFQSLDIASARCGPVPDLDAYLDQQMTEAAQCDYTGVTFAASTEAVRLEGLPTPPGTVTAVWLRFAQPCLVTSATFGSGQLFEAGLSLEAPDINSAYHFSVETATDPHPVLELVMEPPTAVTALYATTVCEIGVLDDAEVEQTAEVYTATFAQVAVFPGSDDYNYVVYAPQRPSVVPYDQMRDSLDVQRVFDTKILTALPAGANRVGTDDLYLIPMYLAKRDAQFSAIPTRALSAWGLSEDEVIYPGFGFYYCSAAGEVTPADPASQCHATGASVVYMIGNTDGKEDWPTVADGEYVRFVVSASARLFLHSCLGEEVVYNSDRRPVDGVMAIDGTDMPVVVRFPKTYAGVVPSNYQNVFYTAPPFTDVFAFNDDVSIGLDQNVTARISPAGVFWRPDPLLAEYPLAALQVRVVESTTDSVPAFVSPTDPPADGGTVAYTSHVGAEDTGQCDPFASQFYFLDTASAQAACAYTPTGLDAPAARVQATPCSQPSPPVPPPPPPPRDTVLFSQMASVEEDGYRYVFYGPHYYHATDDSPNPPPENAVRWQRDPMPQSLGSGQHTHVYSTILSDLPEGASRILNPTLRFYSTQIQSDGENSLYCNYPGRAKASDQYGELIPDIPLPTDASSTEQWNTQTAEQCVPGNTNKGVDWGALLSYGDISNPAVLVGAGETVFTMADRDSLFQKTPCTGDNSVWYVDGLWQNYEPAFPVFTPFLDLAVVVRYDLSTPGITANNAIPAFYKRKPITAFENYLPPDLMPVSIGLSPSLNDVYLRNDHVSTAYQTLLVKVEYEQSSSTSPRASFPPGGPSHTFPSFATEVATQNYHHIWKYAVDYTQSANTSPTCKNPYTYATVDAPDKFTPGIRAVYTAAIYYNVLAGATLDTSLEFACSTDNPSPSCISRTS